MATLDPGSASNNLGNFSQNIFYQTLENRIQIFSHPGSRIRIRYTAVELPAVTVLHKNGNWTLICKASLLVRNSVSNVLFCPEYCFKCLIILKYLLRSEQFPHVRLALWCAAWAKVPSR
jgi:hypothetical protein